MHLSKTVFCILCPQDSQLPFPLCYPPAKYNALTLLGFWEALFQRVKFPPMDVLLALSRILICRFQKHPIFFFFFFFSFSLQIFFIFFFKGGGGNNILILFLGVSLDHPISRFHKICPKIFFTATGDL